MGQKEYTQIWIRKELGALKGEKQPLPRSTFYRWLGLLGITPRRWYTPDHLSRLKDLCLHFLMGGDWKEYSEELEERNAQQTANSQ